MVPLMGLYEATHETRRSCWISNARDDALGPVFERVKDCEGMGGYGPLEGARHVVGEDGRADRDVSQRPDDHRNRHRLRRVSRVRILDDYRGRVGATDREKVGRVHRKLGLCPKRSTGDPPSPPE